MRRRNLVFQPVAELKNETDFVYVCSAYISNISKQASSHHIKWTSLPQCWHTAFANCFIVLLSLAYVQTVIHFDYSLVFSNYSLNTFYFSSLDFVNLSCLILGACCPFTMFAVMYRIGLLLIKFSGAAFLCLRCYSTSLWNTLSSTIYYLLYYSVLIWANEE